MKQKVAQFISYVIEVKQVSKNTRDSYQRDLEKFLNFLEEQGITSLQKITDTTITSYILYLERSKLSESTIARNVATLRGFFDYLLKKRSIQLDPCERIKAPKVTRKAPYVMSEEEVARLLSAPDVNTPKGLRDKAMLELMYATGMKATELIELKMEDIDFLHGIISCNAGKKERLLPFGAYANEVLRAYIESGRIRFAGLKTHSIVFVNHNGDPLTRQGFWKIVKAYGKSVSLEQLSPQSLRHSFAAHLLRHGANVNAVGEILGFCNPNDASVYASAERVKLLEEYQKAHPRA